MTSKKVFTSSDVKAIVHSLRSVIKSHRIVNIYDLNDKTYIFKFSVTGFTEKILLLIESGSRIHITKYSREKNDFPSPFAMKLRRYLRTKRCENLSQLGDDRIIDFQFGSGEAANHLIVEFFSQGNIILTDQTYQIIAVLRSYESEKSEENVSVGRVYPAEEISSRYHAEHSKHESTGILSMNFDHFRLWVEQKQTDHQHWQDMNNSSVNNESGSIQKKNKQKKLVLSKLLLSKDSGIAVFGAEVIDHIILELGLTPSLPVDTFLERADEKMFELLQREFSSTAPSLLQQMNEENTPGYIIYQYKGVKQSQTVRITSDKGLDEVGPVESNEKEYLEFLPKLFKQHENKLHIEYPSFNDAVDEYYRYLEGQKLQSQSQQAEVAAIKKILKVKKEQQNMIESLEKQQERMELHAMLVELYADQIDKLLLVLNSCIDNGMPWNEINEMVQSESASGNPIASLVSKLKLDKNRVIVKLKNLYDDDDEQSDHDDAITDNDNETKSIDSNVSDHDDDAKQSKKYNKLTSSHRKLQKKAKNEYIEVEIDLSQSAYANARGMYSNKKQAAIKESKTIEASQRTIKTVESQAMKSLQAQKLKTNLQFVRKIHWFEKFYWFITSEGYLILSGRDAQQNEVLVKKYLRDCDVYVHADIPGAASCIVRAKRLPGSSSDSGQSNSRISPFAIQEAATLAVCRSKAWTAKIVTSAWWVWAHQVSKKAPTGEYLTTGSFMIHGKKNYLPPSSLELGFGIMFRLDDSCLMKHQSDYKDKLDSEDDETMSIMSEALDKYGVSFDALENRNSGVLQESTKSALLLSSSRSKTAVKNIACDTIIEESTDELSLTQDTSSSSKDSKISTTEKMKEDNSNKKKTNVPPGKLTKSASLSFETSSNTASKQSVSSSSSSKKKSDNKSKYRRNDIDMDEDEIILLSTNSNKPKLALLQSNDNYQGSAETDDDTEDVGSLLSSLLSSQKTRNNKQLKSIPSSAPQTPLSKPTPRKSKKSNQSLPSEKANIETTKNNNAKNISQEPKQQKQRRSSVATISTAETPPPNLVAPLTKQRSKSLPSPASLQPFYDDINNQKLSCQQLLPSSIRSKIIELVSEGMVSVSSQIMSNEDRHPSAGESDDSKDILSRCIINNFSVGDIEELSNCPESDASRIIDLYKEAVMRMKESSESENHSIGILTDIIRTYLHSSQTEDKIIATTAVGNTEEPATGNEDNTDEENEATVFYTEDLDEEEIDGTTMKLSIDDDIDKLTSRPYPDDVLIYAVPVCGPYQSLQHFKYRVKLTPGTQKKGKAAKQAIEVFLNSKESSSMERTLIKQLSDPEMVAVMIGDVRVSTPGLFQVIKQSKTQKKGK